MTKSRQCPQCGGELPADAPMGVCPKCVLNLGVATQGMTQPAAAGQSASGGSPPSPGWPDGGSSRPAFVPPSPQELAASFPQLEILELLGQGGMGAVYKARQPGLDRLVALKVLPPTIGADPAFAERFAREARSLARLNHPNIVAVYDFGQTAGLFYFVMEYVDGVNLRQLERRQPLAPKEALAIVPQICDALQYAHDEGIVHRDIKPENILIDKKGRVKIADFGLAKLLTRAAADYTLTQPQQVMGTMHYMAPEQVEHPATVDQRADIYSLGVVFYEMLTGELPLGRFQPPSQKVQIDVRLDEVVLKTLAREPELRYQQASQVRTDVDRISRVADMPPAPPAAPAPVQAPAAPPPPQSPADAAARRSVRGPGIGLLVTGILSCLGVFPLSSALFWVLWGHPGRATDGMAPTTGELLQLNLPVIVITVGWLGLGIAAAVMILIGSVKMMRLKSSAWARTSAILALLPLPLPCPVTWVLGLAMGIWVLVVLARPEVKAAFAASPRASEAAPAGPADRLKWPAVGLVVAAALNAMAVVGFVVLTAPELHRFGRWPPEQQAAVVAVLGGLIVAAIAVCGLLLLAATGMRRRERYGQAVAGSIVAMVVPPGCLVGIPAGILALAALSKAEVKAAFAAHGKSSPEAFSSSRVGLAVVVWLAAGVGLASLAQYVPAVYSVRENVGLAPVPVMIPMPGRNGEYRSVDRGYQLWCIATGEGWTWGRNPANLGLERQRLTLKLMGLTGVTEHMKMEIDLRTLGYSYYGRDGRKVAAKTDLDARVIQDWMEARGLGVAPSILPAEAANQGRPDEPRVHAEAENLARIAWNWNTRYTEDMLDKAVFRYAGSELEKSVRVTPGVEAAVWIALASMWLAGGALWLRRLRRRQVKDAPVGEAPAKRRGGPAPNE